MKKINLLFLLQILVYAGFSQSLPKDSLFLGQTPPGNEPKIFELEVSSGTFAAERIAITKNGSEIFYSEIGGYYPNRGEKIRYYKYENNKWSGSAILFDGYAAPALSVTNDTLFVEKEFKTYFATRKANGWSEPQLFFTGTDTAHYIQVTTRGNYFTAAPSKTSVGGCDYSKIDKKGNQINYISLQGSLNRKSDDLDYYMSNTEDFLIACLQGPIGISYRDKSGKWSNPRFFNEKINFGIGGWGTYLTPDNKYLFYSTGTKPDYSDVHVYWVNMGNIIDSLKKTNLPPYIKNRPPHQTAVVNKNFTFTLPKDAVCDEDGTKKVTYEILMLDGSALPEWLKFDGKTNTLTGNPVKAEKIQLRVNAYDDKKEATAFKLILTVTEK